MILQISSMIGHFIGYSDQDIKTSYVHLAATVRFLFSRHTSRYSGKKIRKFSENLKQNAK